MDEHTTEYRGSSATIRLDWRYDDTPSQRRLEVNAMVSGRGDSPVMSKTLDIDRGQWTDASMNITKRPGDYLKMASQLKEADKALENMPLIAQEVVRDIQGMKKESGLSMS